MMPPSIIRNEPSDKRPPTTVPRAIPSSVLGRSFSRYSTSAFRRYHATAKTSPTQSMGRMMPVEALPPKERAMSG